MNDERPNREFVEDLLSRDSEVAATNFEEFRMNLENRMLQIEHRARIVRRVLFVGLVLTLAGFFSIFPFAAFDVLENEWVDYVYGFFVIALQILAILVVLYYFRFPPAIARGRLDLQTAMIEDLRRQVAELARRLDERSR